MPGRVFISYSHVDKAYARRLALSLDQAGVPAWWDHVAMSGERFAKVIQDELDRCAAVVVVLTPAALDSIWVQRELAYAADAGKTILPLLLQRCPMPIVLAGLQYEDVTGGRMPPSRFVNRLQGLIGAENPVTPPRKATHRWYSAWADPWAAISAAAVALAVDGAVWFVSHQPRAAAISAVAGGFLAYAAYVLLGALRPR